MSPPAPYTPADCDLRGLQYMPLYGDRLFASATWIAAKPEAKIAALRLWWHAYSKEAPAASLPDDDALLAEYAGYGVAVSAWRKVRASAMRGWVKCSDGRLYHRTVADLALEAWEGRQEVRKGAERKRREREERSRLFADLAEVGVTPAWNEKTKVLRDLHAERVTAPGDSHNTSHVTGGVTSHVTVTARTEQNRTEQTPPTPSKGVRDGERFLAEIRKAMSATGNQRTKPKPCQKLLAPLIAKHGFEALMAASKAFYATPEARKDGGQFQCGLQVALGDGRIEALIKPPRPPKDPAADRPKRIADFVAGRMEWDERLDGPYPSEAELDAARAPQKSDLFEAAGGPP